MKYWSKRLKGRMLWTKFMVSLFGGNLLDKGKCITVNNFLGIISFPLSSHLWLKGVWILFDNIFLVSHWNSICFPCSSCLRVLPPHRPLDRYRLPPRRLHQSHSHTPRARPKTVKPHHAKRNAVLWTIHLHQISPVLKRPRRASHPRHGQTSPSSMPSWPPTTSSSRRAGIPPLLCSPSIATSLILTWLSSNRPNSSTSSWRKHRL